MLVQVVGKRRDGGQTRQRPHPEDVGMLIFECQGVYLARCDGKLVNRIKVMKCGSERKTQRFKTDFIIAFIEVRGVGADQNGKFGIWTVPMP